MKVLCEEIPNGASSDGALATPWLRVGREYLVLEVLGDGQGNSQLRVQGDDNLIPILVSAWGFSTTSVKISKIWVAVVAADGSMKMGPRDWFREGFWEDYFNLDEEALNAYRIALNEMADEES